MNATQSTTESAAVAVEPEEDVYIRLTPQGERLAARLSKQTPAEQVRTMQRIINRVRREQRAKEQAEQNSIMAFAKKLRSLEATRVVP